MCSSCIPQFDAAGNEIDPWVFVASIEEESNGNEDFDALMISAKEMFAFLSDTTSQDVENGSKEVKNDPIYRASTNRRLKRP